VAPGTPTASTNVSSRDPRESEHIRLRCESTGGNPAPNVTWYRNSKPLSAGVTFLPASVKFGATSSLLDMRLSRHDNGANFTCDVENDAGEASTITQLSVHCTLKLSLSVTSGFCVFWACMYTGKWWTLYIYIYISSFHQNEYIR